MSLKTYARKRNFRKTSEPPAKKNRTSRRKLSFVVQEHHARRLHYDFRLEWEGVLKSWAVPKGPSYDPSVKRLAVQVEDHPLEYGKFEGTIPEKQYGAGEVYIWDKGTWIPKIDPAFGLKKGHLQFELKGTKLKGTWDLIRTHYQGRSNQWLLVKADDAYAFSDEDTKPMKKVSKKNPTKTSKKLLRRRKELPFISPELAQLVEEPPEGKNWIHEIKLDGYRIQVHASGEEVRLFTRSGQDWTAKFPIIVEALQKLDLDNAIIDGEVVILDEEGRSDFQLLQNAIKSEQTRNMYYYAFDLMHFGNRDLRQEPLEDRKRQLQTLMRKSVPRVRLSADFNGSGKDLLELAREHHLEGIISKERHSTYRSERNSNWVKTKCTHEQEFVIGGFTDARGSRNHFGALLLGYYKNKQLHYAGRVGTGFTQKSLDEIRKKLKPLETGKSPFTKNSPRERDIHFVRPVLSAQVTFGNWTSDGILRVPVFHGLREDKPAKEIIREKPKKAVSEDSWAISSPEKILFKSEKISKKEVAHYYSIAAAWLVPLVTDRPLSLVRCPSGTSEKCFFQKHPTTMPKAMTPVRLKEEKGSGVYASLHDAEGLAALVQMNAFEIHCSNCRRDDVIHPDQFVMDLDPGPGVPWKQVVASAVELRDLLEKLGLKSFVKLSGGKGLHLHVPIAPLYTWDEINSFTRALALQLEQIKPDLYVSKMTKNIRGGKIFVDYLRNSRGATAVAPYSLRARAVSSVALPVDWADLKKIKTPDEFTLRKTLAHLVKRRRDPWKDYFKIKQRIPLLDKTTRKKQDSVAYSGGASV